MRGPLIFGLISAAVADTVLPSDARVTYVGRFTVPTPAPPPSPSGYFLSGTPGNECPEGSSKITTKDECKTAMKEVGPAGFDWEGRETEKKWPSGCYFCDSVLGCSDGTWFNTHPVGKAHGGARPYCQSSSSVIAPANASADDVKYVGWSGAQIACRFKGTSVSAQLMGGETPGRFLAMVDGQPQKAFVINSGKMQEYSLAQGLHDAEHEVVLWKVTEDFDKKQKKGADAFGGFSAAAFLDAPALKMRRLEFIGDSDTAGWCADGSGRSDPYTLENTHQTWAARLAQDLNADFVAEAVSGIGAYNAKVAGSIIQDLLPNTLPFYSGEAWDVSKQQIPNAVVILIGPNDDKPNSNGFKKAYRQLMDDVVSMYKHASTPPKIIHVCGGSINGFDPCDSIQEVNDDFNSGRSDGFQGYYASISKATWKTINNEKKYQGCDSHYGPLGHETLKNEILPQVRDIMGWSEASEVVV